MIEAALGETLSQSIFSKGKRFGTIDVKDSKGKEDGSSNANVGKEAKTKRTAQDRAPDWCYPRHTLYYGGDMRQV